MKEFIRNLGVSIALKFEDLFIPTGNWLFGICYRNSKQEQRDAEMLAFGRDWQAYTSRQMEIIKRKGIDRQLKIFQMDKNTLWIDYSAEEAKEQYLKATGIKLTKDTFRNFHELSCLEMHSINIRLNERAIVSLDQYLPMLYTLGVDPSAESYLIGEIPCQI